MLKSTLHAAKLKAGSPKMWKWQFYTSKIDNPVNYKREGY